MVNYKKVINNFISQLDCKADKIKVNHWVEKTPNHLHYIPFIEKYVDNAFFIHIIRNGEDVVSSVYNITNNLNEWGGPKDIDRYLYDISLNYSYEKKVNHIIVTYEDLVSNTKTVLEKIFMFLNIEFEKEMITEFSDETNSLVNKDEIWKQNNRSKLKNTNGILFNRLFTEKERDYISNRLK